MKNIVILSGAGISAESGIRTFRDADGLWENHDVMEVASIEGWHSNPELVLNFYNMRRADLNNVKPNKAHLLCAELQTDFNVHVITQNVDDLHERAGSNNILHLHGSLLKGKSVLNDRVIFDWSGDMTLSDKADDGGQIRPAIVWFGEDVPLLGAAMDLIKKCDILIIVGTSLQVYPAASLVGFAHSAEKIFLIDVAIVESYETRRLGENLTIVEKPATEGMKEVYEILMRDNGIMFL